MVVAEKSTQALAAANSCAGTRGVDAVDEFVAKSLMVAFTIGVSHELRQGTPQVPLTKRDEAVQALLFDRPNESLCMRVQLDAPETVFGPDQPARGPHFSREETRRHERTPVRSQTHPP